MTYFFILGASDPEMAEIERVLTDVGVAYGYATVAGRRVHPGNAYAADGIGVDSVIPDWDADYVAVECGGPLLAGISTDNALIVVDHHRPGDRGFGRPAVEYWEASSLGQVCWLIGIEPTPRMRMIAAADHCLRDAYAGRCPDVDPDALVEHRIAQKADFERRLANEIREEIADACRQLHVALHTATERWRWEGVIEGYSNPAGRPKWVDFGDSTIPGLPEAGAITGVAYVATVTERDGRRKRVFSGDPDQVRAWTADEGKTLDGLYGDPARGFAGGYLR